MKIVALRAENVKRLKAVEIRPDGSVVVIGGRNEQGKTSVLDSVAYLLGGKALCPDKPIREGQATATVSADLGELLVERRFTAKGSYLKVTNADGSKPAAPQAVLDNLVGRLSFDPLEWTRMGRAEQLTTVKELAGVDFEELDGRRGDLYNERALCGRDVAGRESQIKAMPEHPDAPAESISVTDLSVELDAGYGVNRANAAIRQEQSDAIKAFDKAVEKLAATEGDSRRVREELAAQTSTMEARIAYLQERAVAENNAVQKAATERDQQEAFAGAAKDVDTTALATRLGDAEATNDKVRANQAKAKAREHFVKAKAEYKDLTGKIEAIDAEKATIVAGAKLPIDELGWDATGVTFKGLPFNQASSAEQLRVSVAMGLAMNPKLRVLLIRDGSKLDEDNLAMVAKMAADADAQVWIERVGEGEEYSVIIEDGAIKEREEKG